MPTPQAHHRFDEDAYRAWEALQTERHECFQGEVFAMAGGTQNHNVVSGNAYMALRSHLKGTPCPVFISDMCVRVAAVDAYKYKPFRLLASFLPALAAIFFI